MTYEEEKEQATRQVAAHARAARDAEWPGKRVQHEESIRYLCDKYGIPSPLAPPPERPPSYEVIKTEWTRLGLDPLINDFWLFHAGQDHPVIGPQEHENARSRLHAAAALAAATHNRDGVWIPDKVKPGAQMTFTKVLPGKPKGERQWIFKTDEDKST